MDDQLAFASLGTVAGLVERRAVSPVELTRGILERIAAVDPVLNAYLAVFADSALDAARRAEAEIVRGDYRGPLHGIPWSVKDIVETREGRTTAGSPVLADNAAGRDAAVVERMAAAGAVLLGKTNLFEFAYGSPHLDFGLTANPWDRNYTTGGSSSGSAAAVAAGLGYASLGTDTGGSIRAPAAWCGLVGLKPTFGRVSAFGVIPLAASLDHVGPLTRTARDAAIVLGAIAGYDPRDAYSLDAPVPDYLAEVDAELPSTRIGIDPAVNADAAPEIAAALEAALGVFSELGMRAVEVRLPEPQRAIAASTATIRAESSAFHRQWLAEHPERYSPAVRARLEAGLSVLAADYLEAQRERRQLRAEYAALLETVDVLLTPTTSAGPTTLDELREQTKATGPDALTRRVNFTGPLNLVGFPAVSVPAGTAANGLPIGLQLVSRPLAEGRLLAVAERYERAAGWTERHPAVP